jgi:hypothetical protein
MSLVLSFFICISLFQCVAAYLELRPHLRGPWRETAMRVSVTVVTWTLLGLIIPVYLVSNLHGEPLLSEVIQTTVALLSFEFLAFMAIGLGVAKVSGPGLRLGGLLSLAAWLGLVMLQMLLIHQGHVALAAIAGLLAVMVSVMALAFELTYSLSKHAARESLRSTGHLRAALGLTAFACFLLLSGLHITSQTTQEYVRLETFSALPSPIEPLLPSLLAAWLLTRLLLTSLLVRLEMRHMSCLRRRVEEDLVEQGNQIILPYQMTAQALFHLPTPILLINRTDQELVYANGLARTLLSDARLTRQPLDTIFLSIVPIGANRIMALFLHPNRSVGLFRLEPIQAPGVSGMGLMLLLHREELDTMQLSHWLITSRLDSPGCGSCLLNSKFSILAISGGWESIFSRYDSYFGSGLIWDRLRSFTDRMSDVLALEEKIGQKSSVSHLLTDQGGREMSVTMQLLMSPDGSPVYHVVAMLTSEANARKQLHRID